MKAISTADGCERFVHVCCCCGSCGCAGDSTTETSGQSKDGTVSHEHLRCLYTPHSHVIDQFFGLEVPVALVVVLSVELGPGQLQPGEL